MVSHCKKTLRAVQADIERIEQAIEQVVKEDSRLNEQCTLATSVPGIGKITALNMIVTTFEFTRISEAKKFACYGGVAPFEHISGSSIRRKNQSL